MHGSQACQIIRRCAPVYCKAQETYDEPARLRQAKNLIRKMIQSQTEDELMQLNSNSKYPVATRLQFVSALTFVIDRCHDEVH